MMKKKRRRKNRREKNKEGYLDGLGDTIVINTKNHLFLL